MGDEAGLLGERVERGGVAQKCPVDARRMVFASSPVGEGSGAPGRRGSERAPRARERDPSLRARGGRGRAARAAGARRAAQGGRLARPRRAGPRDLCEPQADELSDRRVDEARVEAQVGGQGADCDPGAQPYQHGPQDLAGRDAATEVERRPRPRRGAHQTSRRSWKVATDRVHAMPSWTATAPRVQRHPNIRFCSATVARHGV